MSSTKLIFDIKDKDTNDIFNNNPFLINISGEVNICEIICGQEIDSCNSIKLNTMTNYGNILSLNTDTNIKCKVKLPYESEGDNKNYVFKKIFVTVPSLHRINGKIYDMEIYIVFTSIQKDGKKLNLVLSTLLSGTNAIPPSGDSKLLTYTLLNELFSGKNTVPEKFGTSSINLGINFVDINAFTPENGSRSFYSYTHPKNLNTNIRIFTSPLLVSNNILSILKNKLTPGNSYTNMKNSVNTSINPSTGLFFYYNEDFTNNYKRFSSNKVLDKTKNENKKKEVQKKKANNTKKKKSTKQKTTTKKKESSAKKSTAKRSSKNKKEKFTNQNDDIDEDEDDDDIQEDFDDDDDDDDDIEEDFEENDDDIEEDFDDDDDDNDDVDEDDASTKKVEKYATSPPPPSKTLAKFADTDNKNIVSVIIYIGFVFISILFLYIITNNCINNPSEKLIDKENFIEKFKESQYFMQTVKYKIYFFILFIFCIFLGLIMIIFLLIFFYNPTTFLIRSSSAILFFICVFIIVLFYFLGNYIYYRIETSKASPNTIYSDYDKYSLKLFEWFSIKEIINIFKSHQLSETHTETTNKEPNIKKINKTINPLPGPDSNKTFTNQQIFENLGSPAAIMIKKPLMTTILILFILFSFITSCYLFPIYDKISSGYVKDFVRIGGLTSTIYSSIYFVLYVASSICIGTFINENFFKFTDGTKEKLKIENSKIMMITLFIVVLFILSVIFLSYYFKSMITISKVFFIFLSISLGLFILFIGYLFFNKESSEVVKSGNNLDAIAASTVPGSPGSPASHHGSHLASI
jgi:hypothetical protein